MNLEENLRIDINAASAEELYRLPGIDLGLAQRIVPTARREGLFRRRRNCK